MKAALTHVNDLLDELGLDSEAVATELGTDRTTVTNKRAGRRRWSLAEGVKIAALISRRSRRKVRVEDIDFSPRVPATTEAK